MIPATRPAARGSHRLLWIDPAAACFGDARLDALPGRLRPGDLLVVNDAATLPASLPGVTATGAEVEIRLAGGPTEGAWRAVLFGEGGWRKATEDRPPPPALGPGDCIHIQAARAGAGAPRLVAVVESVDAASPRLVKLRFDRTGADLFSALHRLGRPVQYSYLDAPLSPWDVATVYAGPPVAAEPPSAGLALTWSILNRLRARGVRLSALTHAAGLSSTGDASLDARLPLPERSVIPEPTARAVDETRAGGGRIVAVGTTVVRALEGRAAASDGRVLAGAATTDLVLGPGYRPRIVDGLLTGLHETGASHLSLLEAFVPAAIIHAAYAHAEAGDYRWHELGDLCLVLPT